MNISGISGAGGTQPYAGQKASNADSNQLQVKLKSARKDLKDLEKSLSTGGDQKVQIKAEIAKKEQEIQDLEKQIQELKSKEQESNKSVEQNQNMKSSGKDVKANDTLLSGALVNVSAPRDNSKLISGSEIDEYA